jgi:phage tail-like protein
MGFTAITSPELSIATEDITEGSSDYIHHVLGKASTNAITLQRAESAFNSDFWRWIVACLKGNHPLSALDALKAIVPGGGALPIPGKRRNLMLMHMSGVSLAGAIEAAAKGTGKDRLMALAAIGAGSVAGIVGTLTGGLMDLGITSIPAKTFMLFGCLPTRYKPGGDFDASSTTVSIEELDLSYHHFEEFSLMG